MLAVPILCTISCDVSVSYTHLDVYKRQVIGFAMFAVFFGAGNLVFPPQIGLVSGSSVFPAIIGLTLSGILFPMLAVAAVGNVGTNLEDICRHAHAKLHLAFMAVAIPVSYTHLAFPQ